MDNTGKLARKLGDPRLAAALVEAGFDNPAKIRKATDKELRAIDGVGPATLKAIRGKVRPLHKGE
jgi:DNA integrity scanning protein DisA with diadenylate cyclase activity